MSPTLGSSVEFDERDLAFGLGTDVDEDAVAGDLDHLTVDEVALFQMVHGLEILFLQLCLDAVRRRDATASISTSLCPYVFPCC
ncbi:MAG: hypothetical protein MZU97_12135 [Bacillus subtilis]|nr:hypothetical protein [Bacillus subtilis]